MITVGDLPDRKVNASGRGFRQSQQLTRRNMEYVLEWMGLAPRYDMMRGVVAYFKEGERVPYQLEEAAYHQICDILTVLDMSNHSRAMPLIETIARLDPFHPMEDWLKSKEWDGVDRIGQLADSIQTDTELWPVYLENWLVEVVAGVCGWREGAQSLPYVLVLVGGQGLGKTRWFENLGGRWAKTEAELHLSSTASKDHQLECLKYPMVELSELDGIFRRSDINNMKSFISRTTDAIRAPYARTAIERPRVTTFCGSVNEAEFLTDPTGSRRFWPVNVESIAWDLSIDFGQLWAQAYSFWCENPEFSLTEEQETLRAETALEMHTEQAPEVEFLESYYLAHKHMTETYRPMTGAEILRMLGYKNPWSRTTKQAKFYLSKCLGAPKQIQGRRRVWMFPYTDNAQDVASWPRGVQLRTVKN